MTAKQSSVLRLSTQLSLRVRILTLSWRNNTNLEMVLFLHRHSLRWRASLLKYTSFSAYQYHLHTQLGWEEAIIYICSYIEGGEY